MQPVMARLAARWRRSDLVILETLKKGNHSGEAYVRRGRRKALYSTERDSLEGLHEEAVIQRKGLRRGKTWPLAKNMFRKGMSAVEGDPRKSWSGIVAQTEVE